MNAHLPHIAIVLDDSEIAARVLIGLQRLTGDRLTALKRAAASRQPLICAEMFSNSWYDGGMDTLRKVVRFLSDHWLAFRLYELAEGETYGSADLGLREITPEILGNIMVESERTRNNNCG
ncbi:hypothetical protein HOY34_21225 [Xinfangfangia sp. D13-10-4-6]|uniref:hypothetical protein n=1 Tax=Pseudogemmobacter hezensis TaxID=2737662 RepID=UPI00155271DC|nr:hypothetical protein [Pseudogemmobacter hezensis]NPD17704.1 hypothetical protein [Pseudogemmobacter hezensis]